MRSMACSTPARTRPPWACTDAHWDSRLGSSPAGHAPQRLRTEWHPASGWTSVMTGAPLRPWARPLRIAPQSQAAPWWPELLTHKTQRREHLPPPPPAPPSTGSFTTRKAGCSRAASVIWPSGGARPLVDPSPVAGPPGRGARRHLLNRGPCARMRGRRRPDAGSTCIRKARLAWFNSLRGWLPAVLDSQDAQATPVLTPVLTSGLPGHVEWSGAPSSGSQALFAWQTAVQDGSPVQDGDLVFMGELCPVASSQRSDASLCEQCDWIGSRLFTKPPAGSATAGPKWSECWLPTVFSHPARQTVVSVRRIRPWGAGLACTPWPDPQVVLLCPGSAQSPSGRTPWPAPGLPLSNWAHRGVGALCRPRPPQMIPFPESWPRPAPPPTSCWCPTREAVGTRRHPGPGKGRVPSLLFPQPAHPGAKPAAGPGPWLAASLPGFDPSTSSRPGGSPPST